MAPQGAPAQAGRHHHRAGWQRALRGITLTPQQQQQIKAAVAANRPQPGQTVDPQTRRANAQRLRSTIEGILTPAQRTQFEQNLQAMRSRRRAGGEGQREGAPRT